MRVKLKELGVISTGNTPSKTVSEFYDSPDICFVKPDIISDNNVDLISDSKEFLSERARAKARIVKKDAILVTCIGSIGKVGVVNTDEIAFNQQINAIEPNEKVGTRYLAYSILANKTKLQDIANAAVVPIINKTQFGEFEIDITLEKEEQAKIVDALDKTQQIILHKKHQLKQMDELIKARFVELFDGKYETRTLGSVCEELFAGGDVKKEMSSDIQSEEHPYPIYTNGEKNNGLYGYTSVARVTKEAITISGRGTIGFTCLRKEPFYPAVRLIVAIPNQELVSGCYLQHFVQSKNYGGQGASIPQLTVPMVKDELIPVPPMDSQNQFAAFVEQTDKSKVAIQKSLDEMQVLYDKLMQEYFG